MTVQLLRGPGEPRTWVLVLADHCFSVELTEPEWMDLVNSYNIQVGDARDWLVRKGMQWSRDHSAPVAPTGATPFVPPHERKPENG